MFWVRQPLPMTVPTKRQKRNTTQKFSTMTTFTINFCVNWSNGRRRGSRTRCCLDKSGSRSRGWGTRWRRRLTPEQARGGKRGTTNLDDFSDDRNDQNNFFPHFLFFMGCTSDQSSYHPPADFLTACSLSPGLCIVVRSLSPNIYLCMSIRTRCL